MKCHDFGDRPDCLGVVDERYTMRFDDLGEPPIYWCARCGPEASTMIAALTEALEMRGPDFAAELQDAIGAAEARSREEKH